MKQRAEERAVAALRELRYFDSVQALMGWDLWAGLSEKGQPYRQEVSGYFTRQSLAKLKSAETKALVDELREMDGQGYSDIYHRAAGRELIDRYDRAAQVPEELQIELRAYTGQAQRAWRDALAQNSFEVYKPWIKGLFELKMRVAQAIDPNRPPFDVLCDTVDEGIDTGEVGRLFAGLKAGIGEILSAIRDRESAVDAAVAQVPCDKATIRDMALEINGLTGFDYGCAKDNEVMHGMCTGVGPRDSRIAVTYRGPWNGIFTVLHEGGHARYNYGSCQQAVDCCVWGGVGGAVHEGQARFYENILGKSPEFWHIIYPVVQKHLPQLKNVPLEQLYPAVRKVTPSLNRLGADELTYSLHPIIRFEMEKEYFEGKVTTDQFEELWNAKYQECFGLTPNSPKEGVLQDIHWASGHIGYFQSYTLGNLYGGQLLHAMLRDHPDLYARVAQGDFAPVNGWLYEHVHQFGRAYRPKELLLEATGEPLNEQYFLDYLRKRYL